MILIASSDADSIQPCLGSHANAQHEAGQKQKKRSSSRACKPCRVLRKH